MKVVNNRRKIAVMAKRKKIDPLYKKYLQSQKWKDLRSLALRLAGDKCKQCGSRIMLVVHHLKYTWRVQDEPVTDLLAVCKPCHYYLHHGKHRRYLTVKRIVLFKDGNFKEMKGTKPFFMQMAKDDKSIEKIYRVKRFERLME